MDDKRELRTYAMDSVEIRADGGDSAQQHISGHAAVFGTWTRIWDWRERILPGAFTRAIAEDDVRALYNHDPNYVLGRNIAGTLDLAEDDQGLVVDIIPPETQWARDLLVTMGRGDVNQMSFGFTVGAEEWVFNEDIDIWDRSIREISRLWDVSPVTFPAYPSTDAQVRAMGLYVPKPPQERRRDGGAHGGAQESQIMHRIRRQRMLDLIERSL